MVSSGKSFIPRAFYKKAAGRTTSLPQRVSGFGADGIQQQRQFSKLQSVLDYLEEEAQDAGEKHQETQYELDASGKLFKTKIGERLKPGVKPPQAKKRLRRFDYSLGSSELPRVEREAESHGFQSNNKGADETYEDLPRDMDLMSILFLFAVVLVVSTPLTLFCTCTQLFESYC